MLYDVVPLLAVIVNSYLSITNIYLGYTIKKSIACGLILLKLSKNAATVHNVLAS